MRAIFTLSILTLTLSACATGPDFSQMTPEQIQAYQAYQAQEAAKWDRFNAGQQSQMNQILDSTVYRNQQPMQTPEVGSYEQPKTYEHYYCRSVTGQIISCR